MQNHQSQTSSVILTHPLDMIKENELYYENILVH